MNQTNNLSPKGKFLIAKEYLIAANAVLDADSGNILYQVGPVLNSIGLATELMLKSVLSANGVTEENLKAFGHDLSRMLNDVWCFIDQDVVVEAVWTNLESYSVPPKVRARMEAAGETDIDLKWKYYPAQLKLLNEIYDRPYWTRYPTAGPIVTPEPQILLVGIDVIRKLHAEELRRRKPVEDE